MVALRTRLLVCAALSLPVIALTMVPAWQFRYWQWACLCLTAPVAVWGALPFHVAALSQLRRLGASMDTLVSLSPRTPSAAAPRARRARVRLR